MTVWNALICVAVITAWAIAMEGARAWLGTEVKHRSEGHGLAFWLAMTALTVLMWNAVSFLMGW